MMLRIDSANRGGLVGNFEGVVVFIPFSRIPRENSNILTPEVCASLLQQAGCLRPQLWMQHCCQLWRRACQPFVRQARTSRDRAVVGAKTMSASWSLLVCSSCAKPAKLTAGCDQDLEELWVGKTVPCVIEQVEPHNNKIIGNIKAAMSNKHTRKMQVCTARVFSPAQLTLLQLSRSPVLACKLTGRHRAFCRKVLLR